MAEQAENNKLSSLENAPKSLDKNKEIRGFYKEIMQHCEQNKTVTQADAITVKLAADALWIYQECFLAMFNPELGQPEVVVTTIGDKGQTRRIINPALKALQETEKRLTTLLKELGLTPAARAKVLQLEEATESAIMKFMNGGL
ncbi:P27 family phage terminase small subunit [Vibrio fortis]|uniref:P27 family phage terminase small subunit n=1 Tax=Vibrio fortis TaxID=212667 RepID=UPI0038CD195C